MLFLILVIGGAGSEDCLKVSDVVSKSFCLMKDLTRQPSR